MEPKTRIVVPSAARDLLLPGRRKLCRSPLSTFWSAAARRRFCDCERADLCATWSRKRVLSSRAQRGICFCLDVGNSVAHLFPLFGVRRLAAAFAIAKVLTFAQHGAENAYCRPERSEGSAFAWT